ncbi:hypothetical protein RRG08_028124 [Elysia crispata]|uniref:Uncharacterized protein n=1 Tax=Elysia crispata TaxID=231223 RepID=A0AAE1DRS3_9GAST|nr:hypothetical protein RRG08_028124 [Elysia crispata]
MRNKFSFQLRDEHSHNSKSLEANHVPVEGVCEILTHALQCSPSPSPSFDRTWAPRFILLTPGQQIPWVKPPEISKTPQVDSQSAGLVLPSLVTRETYLGKKKKERKYKKRKETHEN